MSTESHAKLLSERFLLEAQVDDLDLRLGEIARLHDRAGLQVAARPADTETAETMARIDAFCADLERQRIRHQTRLAVLPQEPPMRLPSLFSLAEALHA